MPHPSPRLSRITAFLMCFAMASISWAKDPDPVGELAKPLGPQFPNRVLEGHQGSVLWVAFTTDGKTLASSSRDDRIIIWDVASGKQLKTLTDPQDDVYCIAYSPDGKLLAACSIDNRIYLY